MKRAGPAFNKFGLGGDKGLNIFAAGYPVSAFISCDSGAPVDEIEQTLTAGGSSQLRRDVESVHLRVED